VCSSDLGLAREQTGDTELAGDLLDIMAKNEADYTLTFRRLSDARLGDRDTDEEIRKLFKDGSAFDSWAVRWRKRLAEEAIADNERQAAMRLVNPSFIPRNHLVEEALQAATMNGDYAPFEELMSVLATPYEDQPGNDAYAQPPRPDQVVHATFCGT